MGIVWQIVFLTILGFVVVLIPFATFHYVRTIVER